MAVGVTELVGVAVIVGVAVTVGVAVSVGVAVGVVVGVAVGDGLTRMVIARVKGAWTPSSISTRFSICVP